MSLDTAIRLSAEVKGGANIDRVKRSLQDLHKSGQTAQSGFHLLNQTTERLAKINQNTISGIRGSISAYQGLRNEVAIGSIKFKEYGQEIQRLEAKLRSLDGTAEKAGASLGQKLATGLAAAGVGRIAGGSIQATVANVESERRLRSLSQGLDEYTRVQEVASAAAAKFGLTQTQANQEFAQIYARLRPIGLALEDVATFYNGFNTAAKLSGTTSIEASNAFLQLSQAMGEGVLRGENLNSIMEFTPGIVQAIAKEMGIGVGQIKSVAKEGQITADIVLRALARIETEGAPKLAEAMKGPAQQFKNLQIEGELLQRELGEAMLPVVLALTRALTAMLQESNELPEPIKQVGAAAAAAGIAIGSMTLAINAIGGISAATAALKAYAASASAAAAASTTAATAATGLGAASGAAAARAGMLLSALTKLGKISMIVIGVKFAIQGLDELITELVGVRDAESSARAMAERRGLTYVPSAAVKRRNAAAQQIEPGQPRPSAGGPVALPVVPAAGVGAGGGTGSTGRGAAAGTQPSIEDRIAARPFGREIIAAARANNVDPALFAALVEQESGNRQTAISRSGAIGLSQLMPGTARELNVNPYDAMQNLMGGARYLKQQLDRFGLEGGLRAYNQGPGAQQRTPGGNSQESRDYPGLVLGRYRKLVGSEGSVETLQAQGIESRRQYEDDLKQKQAERLNTLNDIANSTERQRQESDLQLKAMQQINPLARQIAEYENEAARITQSYSDEKAKILETAKGATTEAEMKATADALSAIEAIKKNKLELNSLKLGEDLTKQSEGLTSELEKIAKGAGDRLAFEREYAALLKGGINPELARQYLEIDKIAEATKTNLEANIRILEASALQLPAESSVRQELERQVAVLKQKYNAIADITNQAKQDTAASIVQSEEKKIEDQIQKLKDEIKDMTSLSGQAMFAAKSIGDAFASSFKSIVDGSRNTKEALSDFFKSIADSYLQMAAEIIAKQLQMIILQTILKAIGGIASTGSAPTTGAPSTGIFAIPELAAPRAIGGPVNPGEIRPVGERGPELFVPYQAGTIIPAEATEALAAINNAAQGRLMVPFQRSSSSAAVGGQSSAGGLSVPFQGNGQQSSAGGLSVPFLKGADGIDGAAGGGGSGGMEAIKVETVMINHVEYATVDQLNKATRQAASQGAALAEKRARNNVSTRRSYR